MTNIKLVLEIGRFQNKTMSLEVFCNGRLILQKTQFETDNFNLSFDTDLPAKIEFQTSGKERFDTEVDANGKILQDKYVLIKGMAIDNIWVKKWFLESRLFSPTRSNYFGQNGIYWFDISCTDIMDFWLDILACD